ncbi:MAG: molecular chaperone DnaJ [Verrucomicrobiaceae bacterium]|nr:MAG: molecular chaperone DnaJ [Verrucomicrobiaceae bacterium]
MDPYLILGVPPEATDADIRRAYLDGIRRFPPEHAPEQFQALAKAYEQVRDESRRLRLLLFDPALPGATPLDTLVNYCASAPAPKPMDFEQIKTFLRSCTTK